MAFGSLREEAKITGIDAVSGILNGTCNFVLTGMARTARPYGGVLAEAQALGYAEADPAADVEGTDAACKLALLARLAFGQEVPLEAVRTEGITRLQPVDFVYAGMLGRTLRQLGVARRLADGRLLLSVRTHLVSNDSMLARVDGPFNAVQVSTARGGDFVFSGRGAGGEPTATAVLADLVEIARCSAIPIMFRSGSRQKQIQISCVAVFPTRCGSSSNGTPRALSASYAARQSGTSK